MPRALLPRPVRFSQKRGGAGNEHADTGGMLARDCFEQPHIEGRHPHHHTGTRHQPQHLPHVELRQKQHLRMCQHHRVDGHEKPMRVINGQGVQQHIIASEAPHILQRQRVGSQIAMRQHRPLGAPRGAGSVQNSRQIISPARHDCLIRRKCLGLLPQAFKIPHHQHGPRIRYEIGNFSFRVSRVHRHKHATRPQHREIKGDIENGFFRLHQNPLTRRKPLRGKRLRDL